MHTFLLSEKCTHQTFFGEKEAVDCEDDDGGKHCNLDLDKKKDILLLCRHSTGPRLLFDNEKMENLEESFKHDLIFFLDVSLSLTWLKWQAGKEKAAAAERQGEKAEMREREKALCMIT